MSMLYFIIFLIAVLAIGPGFVIFALRRHDLNFEFPEITDPIALANIEKIQPHKQQWVESHTPEKWYQYTSDGLRLVANYYQNGDSHKYAIIIHGYTSKKEDMSNYSSYYYDWGFNVLAVDNRAHGESDGKWIGMGWHDSNDQLLWIKTIVEKDPLAQITLFGISMGGATVMMTSGLDLPKNVKCLVEDCGYSSVWDEFVYKLKQMYKLPPFPVLHLSNLAARIMCKYDLKKASSLDRLSKTKLPILFIHGTADDFVPYSMLDKNIEAYKGPYKEVLRVENAPHAMALQFGLKEYLNTVQNFLSKYIV